VRSKRDARLRAAGVDFGAVPVRYFYLQNATDKYASIPDLAGALACKFKRTRSRAGTDTIECVISIASCAGISLQKQYLIPMAPKLGAVNVEPKNQPYLYALMGTWWERSGHKSYT
jgi:hypothetical protein